MGYIDAIKWIRVRIDQIKNFKMDILPELTTLIHFVKQVIDVRIATLPNADENHLVIIK